MRPGTQGLPSSTQPEDKEIPRIIRSRKPQPWCLPTLIGSVDIPCRERKLKRPEATAHSAPHSTSRVVTHSRRNESLSPPSAAQQRLRSFAPGGEACPENRELRSSPQVNGSVWRICLEPTVENFKAKGIVRSNGYLGGKQLGGGSSFV